jgi:outer membrane protein assembly factor BamC
MLFSKNKMPSRLRGGGSILLASLLLTGCGLLDSKKADYQSVKRSRPLDIPPELSAPAKDDRYTVSEASSKGTTFSSYNAERSAAMSVGGDAAASAAPVAVPLQSDSLRIQRAGTQRWLVVSEPPDQVWLKVRRFVEARGLVVKMESPELRLIETDWAEKAAYVPEGGIRGQLAKALGAIYSTSERDRYRIRLEPGIEPGTTDVFISHRGVEEVYISAERAETRWQPRANDPELEMEMLSRLIRFLGADEQKATAIVAASAANPPGERARVAESGGKLFLDVDERFDRAWRRVGLALDRNGFTVEDRDRANGLYYVRYSDPLADTQSSSKGWFESLAFWRDDKNPVGPAQTTFRIAVVGLGDELSRVEVQDKSGVALVTSTARRILDIVRNELK